MVAEDAAPCSWSRGGTPVITVRRNNGLFAHSLYRLKVLFSCRLGVYDGTGMILADAFFASVEMFVWFLFLLLEIHEIH